MQVRNFVIQLYSCKGVLHGVFTKEDRYNSEVMILTFIQREYKNTIYLLRFCLLSDKVKGHHSDRVSCYNCSIIPDQNG